VRFPLRFARRHALLAAAGAAGILLVLVLGSERFVGSAYADSGAGEISFPLEQIWTWTQRWFAQLALAGGFVPVVVGGAWALREVVRPQRPETGVFAVVALAVFAVFAYATGAQGSQIEERYVAIIGGLPAVALGAAVFLRRAWVLGTVVLGVLAARAIAATASYPDASAFSHLVAPARLLYQQVLLLRADTLLPGGAGAMPTIVTGALVLVAVVVAVLCAPRTATRVAALARRPALVGTVVLVALLGFGAVSGVYTLRKYAPATLPGLSFEEVTWIDRASGGGPGFTWGWNAPVINQGRHYETSLAYFFNNTACCYAAFGELNDEIGPGGELPPGIGRPEHIVRFSGYQPLGFETRVLARSTAFGPDEMRVERFTGGPALVTHRIDGAMDPAGAVVPGDAPVTIGIFPDARERPDRCVWIDVAAPPGGTPPSRTRPLPFRLTVGGGTLRGRLAPGTARRLTFRVPPQGDALLFGPRTGRTSLFVGETALIPCRGAAADGPTARSLG